MPVSMQFNAGSIHASPGGQPPLSSAVARHTLLHHRVRAEDEGQAAKGGGARGGPGRDCIKAMGIDRRAVAAADEH